MQSLVDSTSALGKSANVLAESAEHIEGNRREWNRRERNDTTGVIDCAAKLNAAFRMDKTVALVCFSGYGGG